MTRSRSLVSLSIRTRQLLRHVLLVVGYLWIFQENHSVVVVHVMAMTTPKTPTKNIAIIGSGAAGLVAARAISRLNNEKGGGQLLLVPKVFEKDLASGGVWRHITNSKTRPMYRGLRTNLPKEVMAYRERPWNTKTVKESYVTHMDVVNYLNDYRKEFQLDQFISFGAEVKQLKILMSNNEGENHEDKTHQSLFSPKGETWPKIQLEWDEQVNTDSASTSTGGSSSTSPTTSHHSEVFDAVFICNGHYARPSIPFVPGLSENFQGKIMHSIEYDDPSEFQGETILCVGGRASGADLAREISQHAKYVYLSDTVCPKLQDDGQPQVLDNVAWVPKTVEVLSNGSIRFDDNCAVSPKVDRIIFCTGYDYEFPFINDQSNLKVDFFPGERRVKPLFEQLWHAQYPNLAFVGLPHSVVPFPFFELQVEASLALWNSSGNDVDNVDGLTGFPPLADRLQAAAQDAESGGSNNSGRIQDTHFLGGAQWDYCRKMAKLAGNYDADMEAYIAMNKAIYDDSGASRKDLFPGGPDKYRSTCYERDPTNQTFRTKPLGQDAP